MKSIAWVVLLDVRVLEVRRDLVALLADIQALEPVVVQPELEIVDALLEPGLAGLSVLDRKVLDPIRRRLRLVDHDEAEGENHHGHRRSEAEVDDRDRESTWNPEATDGPDERVQQSAIKPATRKMKTA